MKERKQYTKEFKEGAVRLVTEQSRTHADVAKSLGISEWSVARWVRAAKSEGTDRVPWTRTAHAVRARELRVATQGQGTRRGARDPKKVCRATLARDIR